MTSDALIFTLSAIGISETVYLIKKRMLLEKPVCIIGENCFTVLNSRYSKIFIFSNDTLGVLFYIICSIITALIVVGVEPLYVWHFSIKILVILGSLVSAYFIYLQYKVIKAWCFWCIMSAFTIWLMGIIILFKSF